MIFHSKFLVYQRVPPFSDMEPPPHEIQHPSPRLPPRGSVAEARSPPEVPKFPWRISGWFTGISWHSFFLFLMNCHGDLFHDNMPWLFFFLWFLMMLFLPLPVFLHVFAACWCCALRLSCSCRAKCSRCSNDHHYTPQNQTFNVANG